MSCYVKKELFKNEVHAGYFQGSTWMEGLMWYKVIRTAVHFVASIETVGNLVAFWVQWNAFEIRGTFEFSRACESWSYGIRRFDIQREDKTIEWQTIQGPEQCLHLVSKKLLHWFHNSSETLLINRKRRSKTRFQTQQKPEAGHWVPLKGHEFSCSDF